MKSFRDTKYREWTLSINVSTLARVRAATGIDLTQVIDLESGVHDRLGDVVTLFGVICAVLRPQLQAAHVSEDELGESLDEEAAEAAGLALFEATLDFFQTAKRQVLGPAFRKVIELKRARREQATAAIRAAIEAPEFLTNVEAAMNGSMSGGSFTASPESSVSTPAPSPSANSAGCSMPTAANGGTIPPT